MSSFNYHSSTLENGGVMSKFTEKTDDTIRAQIRVTVAQAVNTVGHVEGMSDEQKNALRMAFGRLAIRLKSSRPWQEIRLDDEMFFEHLSSADHDKLRKMLEESDITTLESFAKKDAAEVKNAFKKIDVSVPLMYAFLYEIVREALGLKIVEPQPDYL